MDTLREMLRVELEQAPDHLSKIVTAQLRKFDQRAATIRAEDVDKIQKRNPQDALGEEVSIFRGAVAAARADVIKGIAWETDKARAAYEKNRDRKPELELAQLRRSENKFKGLGDEEITAMATDYVNDNTATISTPDLNEVRARLRSSGADIELALLNEAAEARHAERPWIAGNAALAELVAYGADLATLKGDEMRIKDPNGSQAFAEPASNLIDYTGSLASVPG